MLVLVDELRRAAKEENSNDDTSDLGLDDDDDVKDTKDYDDDDDDDIDDTKDYDDDDDEWPGEARRSLSRKRSEDEAFSGVSREKKVLRSATNCLRVGAETGKRMSTGSDMSSLTSRGSAPGAFYPD